MGDLLADRIVGPRLATGAAGDPDPSAPARTASATDCVAATPTVVGGLTGRRGTLCYPGPVPGV